MRVSYHFGVNVRMVPYSHKRVCREGGEVRCQVQVLVPIVLAFGLRPFHVVSHSCEHAQDMVVESLSIIHRQIMPWTLAIVGAALNVSENAN